jgi:hypothetical protein
MKKMTVVAIAMSLAVTMFSIANAGFGKGMGGGCGDCAKNTGTTATAPSDQFRKFQADTIDLRQDMMLKRFEIQRENLKATPDAAKIAALQADIKNTQAKIHAIRDQSGLPTGPGEGECGQKMGGCNKMNMGDCNKMGMGGGKGMGGCNGPCGAQK